MKAVIFDMDGVIIDSEPIHNRTMLATFARFGLSFDPADFEQYVGTTNAYVFEAVARQNNAVVSIAEMDRSHYQRLLQTIRVEPLEPIPGIRALLQSLREKGIPAAIASSSSLELIETVTKKFGIDQDFVHFTSGEDLPKSKPDPAIYLLTAEKLGVAPSECLVIEDATLGVQAAKAAGMTCIGFQNPGSGNQDLSQADAVVPAIGEIRLERYF